MWHATRASSMLRRAAARLTRGLSHSSSASASAAGRRSASAWPLVTGAAAALAMGGVAAMAAQASSAASTESAAHSCCHAKRSADAAASRSDSDDESAARLSAAHAALRALLGDRFSTDSGDVQSHASDAYSYHKAGEGADAQHASAALTGVAYPESTEEVSRIVRICASHRVAIIPYGSGTSLEGHTSAPRGGVCVDLSHMQAITRLSVDDMDCSVQPGLSWNNLNAALESHGLFYPVDPGPGASIGGMVATSCSGTNAVRYGTMKHNVLSLTVVLPDGSIVRTGGRARKSSAGYDLTRLFVGSEGTLGIVTEITLRLQPLPQSLAVATCSFPSVRAAADATAELVRRGVRVGCVEMLDEGCISAVNSYAGLSYPLRPATLFFKFHGSSGAVEEEIATASSVVQSHGADRFQFATDAAQRDKLWEARKGALWAAIASRPGCEAWTTDVCVPLSRMADQIEAVKRDLAELDLDSQGRVVQIDAQKQRNVAFPHAVVGHVGDGNFHVIMMLDPSNPRELSLASAVNDRMVRRALAAGGTCTGEHGVGVGKKKYLSAELGEPAIDLMRAVKRAIDPHNIMNPGKIFDLEKKAACVTPAQTTFELTKNGACCGGGAALNYNVGPASGHKH